MDVDKKRKRVVMKVLKGRESVVFASLLAAEEKGSEEKRAAEHPESTSRAFPCSGVGKALVCNQPVSSYRQQGRDVRLSASLANSILPGWFGRQTLLLISQY